MIIVFGNVLTVIHGLKYSYFAYSCKFSNLSKYTN